MTDILVALYYRKMNIDPQNPHKEDRDRFILSKGHSVETLYCVLADMGFFPKEELSSYSAFGSRLFGHPTVKVPGVEICSGALGHGESAAVGMALAAKRYGIGSRVYVIMGDGEQAEGFCGKPQWQLQIISLTTLQQYSTEICFRSPAAQRMLWLLKVLRINTALSAGA